MAERIRTEVQRFSGGLNNSTSLFGTPSSGQSRDTDAFKTSASDADGTGVWIQPSSGGTLAHFPRTTNTTAFTSLDAIWGSAYGKHTDGSEGRIVYGEGDSAAKDRVIAMSQTGAEGVTIHTFTSADTKRPSIISYNNQFLIANGVDSPISIAINDLTGTGVTDPITEARPLVTSGAGMSLSAGDVAGNVKGTVKYYIAQVTGSGDSLAETALSISHANLTIDAGINQDGQGDQITITFPNHADYNTLTFRIYRTLANQVAPNYLAEIVVGASGGTYVDNIPDAELGDPPYLHGDPPPSGITSWVVHRGRVFGLVGNTLYFSDPGEHTSWFTVTGGNSLLVHADDGDVGTALARSPDGLVIFKANHIYLLLGDGPDNFRLSDALSTVEGHNIGTPHVNSVVAVPGGLVFYWNNGVYALSSNQVIKISGPVESQWVDPTTVFPEDDGVALGFDPRFGHVYVGFNYTTVDTPESAFIFDLNAGRWIGASQNAGAKDYLYDPGLPGTRGSRFYGMGANGLTTVRRLVRDKFDASAGTAEASRWEPAGSFKGRDANILKRWLYLDFFFTDGQAAQNVTVTPKIDGTDLSAVTVPLPTTPGRKRVNIGEMGYRLTYEFKSASGNKPYGIVEVKAAYQEFKGASV